jgi:hypothetical protein
LTLWSVAALNGAGWMIWIYPSKPAVDCLERW